MATDLLATLKPCGLGACAIAAKHLMSVRLTCCLEPLVSREKGHQSTDDDYAERWRYKSDP